MITGTSVSGMYIAVAAQSNSSSNNNMSVSVTNATSSSSPSGLDKKMQELLSSNDPKDIATLAYIYGFPLVGVVRTADYTTSPNLPPGPGRGPVNTFNHFRVFPNAGFRDIVRPNVDTLYSTGYLNLKKEPLVLQVPPIPADRYYSLQFIDAYSNNFLYIGTRLNDTKGGTYLVTGPSWNGTVPSGMKEIKSPTNVAVIGIRTLVKGPDDVSTVHSIQDKYVLTPLSIFESKGASTVSQSPSSSSVQASSSNASKEIPVAPDPALILKTGIRIYDEISNDMVNNPPPSADSAVLTKFKAIGIGPGKMPTVESNNTVKKALESGIVEGEKLIDQKIQKIGTAVNGWNIPGLVMTDGHGKIEFGNYGTDYLLRAAVAKFGLFANSAEEAVYPTALKDNQGQNLTGAHNYVIHFNKGQTPPVKSFWSLTLYNNKSYLADNPINRYSIGDRTPGLKYNADGSLDIYLQNVSPGKDKESNWLPSPKGDFSLNMRLYIPKQSVLNGEYQYPPIKQAS
jgi:DNA sulfur modification protein DndE